MPIILKCRRRHRRIAEARMLFEVRWTAGLHIAARRVEAIVIGPLRNRRELSGRRGRRINNDGPVGASGHAERQ
jgi:hypothetical protein